MSAKDIKVKLMVCSNETMKLGSMVVDIAKTMKMLEDQSGTFLDVAQQTFQHPILERQMGDQTEETISFILKVCTDLSVVLGRKADEIGKTAETLARQSAAFTEAVDRAYQNPSLEKV